MTISNQFIGGSIAPLPAGSILRADVAASLTARINALNAQIVSAASVNGAFVYDLNAFLHKVKVSGASAGTAAITANYLGGFYSLDGVYPGPTGNALIANDLLALLNAIYGTSFPLINPTTVASADAVTAYRRPGVLLHTARSLGLSERVQPAK